MKTDQTIRYSKKRTVMLALTIILLLLLMCDKEVIEV